MRDLKICPFCDSWPELVRQKRRVFVRCIVCGAEGFKGTCEEMVIAAWNRRPNPTHFS